MTNSFLIGRRVYLRPLEAMDAGVMAAYLNDPEVMRTLKRANPLSTHAEQTFIQRMAESNHDLALGIVVVENDRLIGVTGLHQFDWVNRQACFGIAIGAKEEWGKGFGTDATSLLLGHAFQTLNLNRVWLHVLATHTRGIRTYEKVGFQREGILRQALFREGQYQDLLTMAILQEDWGAVQLQT